MSQNHINNIKQNPTKIFLHDYKPILLKKKIKKLDEYFRKMENYIEIVSPDGLFSIENERLYKLKPLDKEIVKCSLENFELLIDDSYFDKEIVLSQIPYDNISSKIHRFYYSQEPIGKKTFLTLVIEGTYDNTHLDENLNDKYLNFTPRNFYFLTNERIDNILIKKELNVFLSLLK